MITMKIYIDLHLIPFDFSRDSQKNITNRDFQRHLSEILADMWFLGESTLDNANVGEIWAILTE